MWIQHEAYGIIGAGDERYLLKRPLYLWSELGWLASCLIYLSFTIVSSLACTCGGTGPHG